MKLAIILVLTFGMISQLIASTPVRKPSDLLTVYRECVVTIDRQYVGDVAKATEKYLGDLTNIVEVLNMKALHIIQDVGDWEPPPPVNVAHETTAKELEKLRRGYEAAIADATDTRIRKLKSTAKSLAQTARRSQMGAHKSGKGDLAEEWEKVAEQFEDLLHDNCFISCASLAQATEPEAKLVYADKPVDVFIDVINAENYVAANTAVARAGDLALSQKGLLFSLSRRAALNLTNQLHWFAFPNASIGSKVNKWRMESPKERMSWLLCQIFGLDEGKYQRSQKDFDGERSFMVLLEDCVDALDALSKQKEEERVKSVIGLMEDMGLDELQALAENERSGKVLGILATNANVRIRLAVAKNGETPFALLKRMRGDANSIVAEAAEKNLIYARSPLLDSTNDTLPQFIEDLVFVQDVRQMDDIAPRILKLSLHDREDLLQWLASRLCDIRFSPTPGEGTPPPGHDLSLIGGKCAYILEKTLGEELVPVRRDTPIETLNEQRERLMKRINDMR